MDSWISTGLGVLAAAAVGYFAWLFLTKERYGPAATFGLIAVVFIFCSFPWFQALLKTWVVTHMSDAFTALGKRLDDVQKTTGEMQGQLSRHQSQIDTNQNELEGAQSEIRVAQKGLLAQQVQHAAQQEKIYGMQTNLHGAQTNLEAQAKKLSDVQYWVENLYANLTSETFEASDARIIRVPEGDGKQYVFLLKDAPIRKSVQVKVQSQGGFGGGEVTRGPHDSTKNLVVVGLFGFEEDRTKVTIQYVRDIRETNRFSMVGSNLVFEGRKVEKLFLEDRNLALTLP